VAPPPSMLEALRILLRAASTAKMSTSEENV
jgi:hypothetical protein